MATKASIAALMALVAACPKPAPAADGGPIMAAQRGVGFGCPAPRVWEMVNGVATCKMMTVPDPAPAPVPPPPPPPPAPPPADNPMSYMNGKKLTVSFYNGNTITVTGANNVITAVLKKGAAPATYPCSVSTAGGQCANGTQMMMDPRDSYTQATNGYSGGGQGGAGFRMSVGSDGSLTFWGSWQGAYSGGNACAYWNNSNGALSAAQVKALPATATASLAQQFGNQNGCF